MFPPEIGGVENVAFEITRIAIEKGFLSKVLTFSRSSKTIIERWGDSLVVRCGVCYRKDPIRIGLSWKSLYRRIADKVDIELFHVPSGFPELLCMKKPLSRKRIVLYHADTVGEDGFRRLYREKILPRFLKTADLIVSTSERIIETSSVLSSFKDKCKVVPLFVDTEHFTPYGEVSNFKESITKEVKSYILCKFVLVSGNGLMHFSYFLLKAIDFRA
jgi:rhamnosyl/mannosyltransferase